MNAASSGFLPLVRRGQFLRQLQRLRHVLRRHHHDDARQSLSSSCTISNALT